MIRKSDNSDSNSFAPKRMMTGSSYAMSSDNSTQFNRVESSDNGTQLDRKHDENSDYCSQFEEFKQGEIDSDHSSEIIRLPEDEELKNENEF